MNQRDLQPGDVVQLSPEVGNPAFACAFMVVTDPLRNDPLHTDGVQEVPERERAKLVRMRFGVRCTRECKNEADCDNSCRTSGVKEGGDAA